jgi:hypothetical protein
MGVVFSPTPFFHPQDDLAKFWLYIKEESKKNKI